MYLFIKLSTFHGVPQTIFHCNLRIPESQELYPGLFTIALQINGGKSEQVPVVHYIR